MKSLPSESFGSVEDAKTEPSGGTFKRLKLLDDYTLKKSVQYKGEKLLSVIKLARSCPEF